MIGVFPLEFDDGAVTIRGQADYMGGPSRVLKIVAQQDPYLALKRPGRTHAGLLGHRDYRPAAVEIWKIRAAAAGGGVEGVKVLEVPLR